MAETFRVWLVVAVVLAAFIGTCCAVDALLTWLDRTYGPSLLRTLWLTYALTMLIIGVVIWASAQWG